MTLKELSDLSFKNPIMVYDGVCSFCNSTLQFILAHEKENSIKFLAYQTDTGKELLKSMGKAEDDLDSVVFIENGNYYLKSEVTVEFAKYLKSPWDKIQWIKWIPGFIRNFGYDIIAKYRYRLMGKHDSCQMPTPEQRTRFLSFD